MITGVDVKSFDTPDEVVPVGEKASAKLVDVNGVRVWELVFEPGWRYTEHMDRDLCPEPHAAYIESGRLAVEMADGRRTEAGPGAVMVIEPQHDAWTVGDEPCVFIDFGESLAPAGVT